MNLNFCFFESLSRAKCQLSLGHFYLHGIMGFICMMNITLYLQLTIKISVSIFVYEMLPNRFAPILT